MNTCEKIEQILIETFSPTFIEVIDESPFHKNHLEALKKPSAGHYKLILVSDKFEGLSHIARHRLVYQALAHLMDTKIHALSMDLKSSK